MRGNVAQNGISTAMQSVIILLLGCADLPVVPEVRRQTVGVSCSRSTCWFHSRLTARHASSFWPSRQ